MRSFSALVFSAFRGHTDADFHWEFASVRTLGLSLYETLHTETQCSLEHEDISKLINQELLLNSE